MTPPLSMESSLEGCGYVTPGAIPSYELVIKTLELHTNAVHKVHTNVTPKIMTEKPKRPTISVNMTESDWVFMSTNGKDTSANQESRDNKYLMSYGRL